MALFAREGNWHDNREHDIAGVSENEPKRDREIAEGVSNQVCHPLKAGGKPGLEVPQEAGKPTPASDAGEPGEKGYRTIGNETRK